MGILAGYLALLLGPTYYLRRRIGAKRWRLVHRATVVVFALAVAHSLGSGTDGASLWLRVLVLGSAAAAAIMLALRYRSLRSARRRSRKVRSGPEPTGAGA